VALNETQIGRVTPHSWMSKLHRNLGLLFLLGFIVIGVANAFLLPPFQVPDERRHWSAAHHHMARLVTGSGTVCSTDVALANHFKVGLEFRPEAKLPSGTFSRIAELVPECEGKLLYTRGNVSSYPGVVFSRLFVPREPESGQESLFGFYLSRLLHGFLVGLMIWRLRRLAGPSATDPPATGPPGLLLLFLLTLSPLFLQQSFGVTNDVVTIGFALAVCGWIVFPDRQTRFDEALVLCLGLLAAFTKPMLSIPLLPAIALGLYLDRIRGDPESPAPLVRSLAEAFAKRWPFVLGLAVISAAGLAYVTTYVDLAKVRPAAQFEFILEHPWHSLDVIASKFTTFFWHPIVFIDNLGYMSTRIGSGTLASFSVLVAIVGFVELAGVGTRIYDLRNGRARSQGVRRAYGPAAVLAIVAIASLAAGAFAIAIRQYLVASPVGGQRLYGMHPRYLFPHLVVGLGLAMAMARTFLAEPRSPAELETKVERRAGGVAAAVVIGLAAATLLAFAVHLATDLMARYS
jgi:hypothetical protein